MATATKAAVALIDRLPLASLLGSDRSGPLRHRLSFPSPRLLLPPSLRHLSPLSRQVPSPASLVGRVVSPLGPRLPPAPLSDPDTSSSPLAPGSSCSPLAPSPLGPQLALGSSALLVGCVTSTLLAPYPSRPSPLRSRLPSASPRLLGPLPSPLLGTRGDGGSRLFRMG